MSPDDCIGKVRIEYVPGLAPHTKDSPAPKQRCPVCGGCGLVEAGFYDLYRIPDSTSASLPMRETCRACHGSGLV